MKNWRAVVIGIALAALPVSWLLLWVTNIGILTQSDRRLIFDPNLNIVHALHCTYFIGVELLEVRHYGVRCPVFKRII